MQINLKIIGTDEDKKEQYLELNKNDENNNSLKVTIGYQSAIVTLDELKKAIDYLEVKEDEAK